ncbi:transposase family protein [Verrucomicrobium sp. GAS474]|uniref:transposase family protein n=1 Tax=Verrucomicrobium sp. GAS474 TaxID=1882831 RepID=UPI00138FB614|nr:transposase family protein [Verrucomicrobium sp. GAS474]
MREYVAGVRLKTISKKWGIESSEIRRFFRGCIKDHPDGRVWGFRALIPGIRTGAYKKVRLTCPSRQYAGALALLFYRYPRIQQDVEAHFLSKHPRGLAKESRAKVKTTHKLFIRLCREAGISGDEYPFPTKELGRRALAKHLRSLADTETNAFTGSQYGSDAARAGGYGGHGQNDLVTMSPYQRVFFDGHRIDSVFSISYQTPHGEWIEAIAERPWLLIIMDVWSRAILGYIMCLKAEYSADDILRCTKRTIEPWKPIPLTIPGLKRSEAGGMPSGRFPQLHYAAWDELWYDNAKANLADRVRDKLVKEIGCAVNAGPVKTPERRGVLERLFQTLEEAGFHRLPSTTGSGPQDTRRKNAEKSAVKFKIKAHELEQVLDVIISNYNGTSHSSLNWRSPLEVIQFYLEQQEQTQ